MSLTVINDEYVDSLISSLSRPLADADRDAFTRAAQDAVSNVPCLGEGALHRAIAPLQRAFRDPPADGRALWDIGMEIGPSKLRDAPPIEHGGRRRHVRNR
jgi:hypothetical protein